MKHDKPLNFFGVIDVPRTSSFAISGAYCLAVSLLSNIVSERGRSRYGYFRPAKLILLMLSRKYNALNFSLDSAAANRETASIMPNETLHPCLTCGACCAYFRASFYWAEGNDVEGGTVPVELTDKLNDFMRVMKGTNSPTPRCIALQGTIGERIWCSIYEQRSSVCREFPVAWENGEPHDRCDKARAAWGLPPLTPDSWHV